MSFPHLQLQRIESSLRVFDRTPFLQRVPSTWLALDVFAEFDHRMRNPGQYCAATVIGYWGPTSATTTPRYMPCLERLAIGQRCPAHTPVPTPAARPPVPVVPALLRAQKPQTVVAPVSRPRQRCRDCGDFLPVHRQLPWCVRCNKVRIEASRKEAAKAHSEGQPPPIYNCLACRTRIADPGSGPRLCSNCLDTRYVEQFSENNGVLVRTTGALPHLAFYMNRCGESVVNGRILPHPRYGESRPDRFGDNWDPD